MHGMGSFEMGKLVTAECITALGQPYRPIIMKESANEPG